MQRSSGFRTSLAALLVVTAGCATAGEAISWPVKTTVSVAGDVTRHAARTAISVGVDTLEFAVTTSFDAALDVASAALDEEVVEMALEEAVRRQVHPVAATVVKKVWDRESP